MDNRAPLRTEIEANLEDQLALTEARVTIMNLSERGMDILTERYLPKGTKYRVTMKRPPLLSVRGQVVSIRGVEPSGYRIGLDFVDLDEENRRRLFAFLESERRRLPTNG